MCVRRITRLGSRSTATTGRPATAAARASRPMPAPRSKSGVSGGPGQRPARSAATGHAVACSRASRVKSRSSACGQRGRARRRRSSCSSTARTASDPASVRRRSTRRWGGRPRVSRAASRRRAPSSLVRRRASSVSTPGWYRACSDPGRACRSARPPPRPRTPRPRASGHGPPATDIPVTAPGASAGASGGRVGRAPRARRSGVPLGPVRRALYSPAQAAPRFDGTTMCPVRVRCSAGRPARAARAVRSYWSGGGRADAQLPGQPAPRGDAVGLRLHAGPRHVPVRARLRGPPPEPLLGARAEVRGQPREGHRVRVRHAARHGCAPALQREVLPRGAPVRPLRHRGGVPLPVGRVLRAAASAFLLAEMVVFIGILFLGWYYVIRKGAVDWAKE